MQGSGLVAQESRLAVRGTLLKARRETCSFRLGTQGVDLEARGQRLAILGAMHEALCSRFKVHGTRPQAPCSRLTARCLMFEAPGLGHQDPGYMPKPRLGSQAPRPDASASLDAQTLGRA